jgi:hypothetical protein
MRPCGTRKKDLIAVTRSYTLAEIWPILVLGLFCCWAILIRPRR